jgi:hypothetical protein
VLSGYLRFKRSAKVVKMGLKKDPKRGFLEIIKVAVRSSIKKLPLNYRNVADYHALY